MTRFLHDVLLRHAARLPDATAIVHRDRRWTYRELAARIDALAGELRRAGAGLDDRILIATDTTPEAIALVAACSVVGAVFTVVSPAQPAARILGVAAELAPACILAAAEAELDQAPVPIVRFGDAPDLGDLARAGVAFRGDGRRQRRLDTDLAYVLFTSGSTGRPKGIAMSHLAVVSFLDGLIASYEVAPGERYASSSPLQFDYALLDIGLCLGSGATLVIPTLAYARRPALMVQELRALAVDHFSGVPTLWKLMLRHAADEVATLGLRRIVFAGEHFPPDLIRQLYRLLPGLEIFNIYGQSETIACSFTFVPSPLPPELPHLPVGRGHPDVEMFLLDDAGALVTEPGQAGELYLRGRIVFSGYWGNAEETSRRLVAHPLRPELPERVFRTGDICYADAGGTFYFIGRRDNQIKVNGNRVELEDVELALTRHADVAEACVVATSDDERTVLRAFVVGRSERPAEELAGSLRAHLSALLPSYMRPKHIHVVDRIPLTANGKSDRRALVDWQPEV
jgi:amino acid adenylation domain-containing protein